MLNPGFHIALRLYKLEELNPNLILIIDALTNLQIPNLLKQKMYRVVNHKIGFEYLKHGR